MAKTVTFTIPDGLALEIANMFDAKVRRAEGVTKEQHFKNQVKNWIKGQLLEYRLEQAKETAETEVKSEFPEDIEGQ